MTRLYRTLLVIAPRPLRDAHADEMYELFANRLAAARGAGRIAVLRVVLSAILDLLRARAREWRIPSAVPSLHPDERKPFMFGSDIHFALRSLRRQRAGSALVIAMLALAIAANVAVFSLVNGLFLRPLPFPHQERLVYLNETAPRWNLDLVGINYPDFVRWRKDAKLFESMALYSTSSFNLSDAHGADRIRGALVTWDFPHVLQITPMLGRTFTPDEDRPKAAPVIVITASFWRERFGADPEIAGKSVRVDGRAATIVGVVPDEGAFPDGVRLWAPLAGDPLQQGQSYDGDGIARLKPGVSASDADKDLKRAHQPIWDATDKEHVVSPIVRPLRAQFVNDYRVAASTMTGAVAVILLIACANVAAVMLARALARRREIGIRLALGSSRSRLMRQLLAENLLLAVAGGAIGLLLGEWALGALLRLIPDQLPRWAAFQIDFRVGAFSVGIVLATVILFGWAPALHAAGGDLRSAVQDSTAGTTRSPRGRRTLRFLVAGEFALAAVLLVCGALLAKSFDRVRRVDPGFRPDHVLVATVPISEATRPKPEQWMAFWSDLLARAERIPGVDATGLITCLPLGCHWGNFYTADGGRPPADGKDPVVLTRLATPGYFEAMGIRLRQGRFFREEDNRHDAAHVAIVNETFVRTFWGDGVNAVGRRLRYRGPKQPWMTVIGVVADVKHYGLERPMRPGLYFPVAIDPRPVLTIALHTAVPPESIAPVLRQTLREMDPEIPLSRVTTMEEEIRRSTALRAAYSWMLAVFATLAFILAIGGAYGVSTYLVTQRTREIGIRVALGARTRDVFRSVVGSGVAVVGSGVLVGLLASQAVGRVLGEVLFGVSPHDAGVVLFVAAVLVGTALVANGIPARRAARIDPMRTLRTE